MSFAHGRTLLCTDHFYDRPIRDENEFMCTPFQHFKYMFLSYSPVHLLSGLSLLILYTVCWSCSNNTVLLCCTFRHLFAVFSVIDSSHQSVFCQVGLTPVLHLPLAPAWQLAGNRNRLLLELTWALPELQPRIAQHGPQRQPWTNTLLVKYNSLI